MTVPSRHRFASLPASPGRLLKGWPRSVGAMQQVGFSRPCTAADLVGICVWAGLAPGRRGVQNSRRFTASALARLAGLAACNGRSNTYHHAGHFTHVVAAAGLLAAKAGIGRADRDLLVLAALVHDLDHHGRRGSAYPLYGQERWSSRIVARIILRHGGDARLVRRLRRLIDATALTADPRRKDILASDPLARLLCDADVFASLFYERRRALGFTGLLKFEQGLSGDPASILDGFAARMEGDGLASEAGRDLLCELAASRRPQRNVVTGKGWA